MSADEGRAGLDEIAELLDDDSDAEDGEEATPGNDGPREPRQNQAEDDPSSKKYKKGIVYLPFIPPKMTPQVLRDLLSLYGQVGRIYLQAAPNRGRKKKAKKKQAKSKNFTEGWVEFLKKRTAKKVALQLNNTNIGGKKRNKFHDYIWNLKYLPRFKWIHLVERLSYERAVYRQRMRTEISQAKKIADHFSHAVDLEEKQKRLKKSKATDILEEDTPVDKKFPQKETLDEIVKKKVVKKEKREDFLKTLFS